MSLEMQNANLVVWGQENHLIILLEDYHYKMHIRISAALQLDHIGPVK